MTYLYIYGIILILLVGVYILSKSKDGKSRKFLYGVNTLLRPHSQLDSSGDDAEAILLLEEMYKEFTLGLEDVQLKNQELQHQVEQMREELASIKGVNAGLPMSASTLTTKDIAHMIGSAESTVRKWEKEFGEYIPKFNDPSGSKRHNEEALRVFFQIKFLRDRRVPTDAIKEELAQGHNQSPKKDELDDTAYHQAVQELLNKGLSASEVAQNLGVSVTEIQILQDKLTFTPSIF